MKTFLALGVLCLLFCLAWVQEKPVATTCTHYVLWVFVKKDLFGDGVLVKSQELSLGIGCPVTRELPDKFELQYLVRHCGIKKTVFETYTRFECSLYYERRNRSIYRPSLEFPLTCIVYRKRNFQNSIVSALISTSMPNQKNFAKRTELSVSRPTYWEPDSNHLQGNNMLQNLKPPQETKGLLLISHFISVAILWKQGRQSCPGICCHKVPSGNFSLSDLSPRRIRAPYSLDLVGLNSFLPPLIDQENSASIMQYSINGLFCWIPLLDQVPISKSTSREINITLGGPKHPRHWRRIISRLMVTGSEFFYALILSSICHYIFWYGDFGLVVS